MGTNGVSMVGAASPLLLVDGDPAAELAALSVTAASNQREIARTARETAEASEVAEDDAQVTALHEKADELRTEATYAMWAGVVSGAAQAGAGAIEWQGAMKGTDAAKTASDAAKLVEGGGKATGAMLSSDADHARARSANLDADAATHEKAADMAKHRVDDARDMAHDANDSANKALDWYRDYASARSQATAAALHRA